MESLIHFLKHITGLCGEAHPSILVSGLSFFTVIFVYLGDIINYIKEKIQVSKYNKPIDRAYFEKKKNPKYDDGDKLTKCCKKSKYQDTMMKGNKEDWKLIEDYIERKLYEYPDTVSITPIFCDECGRFKEYVSEINLEKKW